MGLFAVGSSRLGGGDRMVATAPSTVRAGDGRGVAPDGAVGVGSWPLVVSRRGGLGAVRVPAWQPSASWEIGAAGTLSAFVRLDDLRRAGLDPDLTGRWVGLACGAAGPWGGVVTSATLSGDEVEVGATGWAVLASGRVARRTLRYPALGPAALLRRLLGDLFGGASFLRLDRLGSGGEAASLEVGAGDDVGDLLARVAEGAGVEWRVLHDRTVEVAGRLGRDLTGSVRLVGGRHFADEEASLGFDLLGLATTLVGFGAAAEDERGAQAAGGGEVSDAAAVARVGAREEARRYPDVRGGANLLPRLRREVAAAATPPVPLSLETRDVDGVWARFREGDAVRVVLGLAGIEVDLRVMARAWDGDAGTQSLAGEATRRSLPPPIPRRLRVVLRDGRGVTTRAGAPIETVTGLVPRGPRRLRVVLLDGRKVTNATGNPLEVDRWTR